MFGKRNRPVQPEPPRTGGTTSGQSPGGGPPPADDMPWASDPAAVACNLAFGNLANNLASWVEHEGRVHAETYVAVSGAIAGYAAQKSLMQDPGAMLQAVRTASGEEYLFGDALNEMLLARTDADAPARVLSRAAGAAVSVGMPMSAVPKLDDMFGHVSACLGGPMEGRPSSGPDHQPIVPVRELLALYWPHVLRVLRGDIDDLHRRMGLVPPRLWRAVTAYASARPIIDVKEVLDPRVALIIAMESAIYGSKLTRL